MARVNRFGQVYQPVVLYENDNGYLYGYVKIKNQVYKIEIGGDVHKEMRPNRRGDQAVKWASVVKIERRKTSQGL